MRLKACSDCNKELPENEEHFRLYKYDYKTEYCDICLNCEREARNEYSRRRYQKTKRLKYDLSARDWEDALKYFNYKDAYTGMPLINPTMEHIIPISQNGETVRQNIIPCNHEINCSKGGRHMIEWFKDQCFFSEKRLEKIFQWMGDYEKYLYIPIEQREYIDVAKSRSIYHYTITLPNNKKKKLYYANNGNQKKRTLTIKSAILNEWEDYFNQCWLSDDKKTFYLNGEDKTKSTLDRCGGFLLANDRHPGHNVLTKKKWDRAYKSEVPLSSAPSNVQDFIDGSDYSFEYTHDKNKYRLIDNSRRNTKYGARNWAESKTKRMGDISRGLIDRSKPYIAEWCIVDTENVFSFKDIKYTINKEVEQYNIREKKPRFDDYRNDYQMDKILVYEQDGERYYFDQDIYRINNDMIEELSE